MAVAKRFPFDVDPRSINNRAPVHFQRCSLSGGAYDGTWSPAAIFEVRRAGWLAGYLESRSGTVHVPGEEREAFLEIHHM